MDNNLKEKQDVVYEEVPSYQEVAPQPKKVKTGSYFDGGLLELIGWRLLGFLITMITFGIGAPWAKCMLYSYQYRHTVYNGKRLRFEGTGGDLFVNIFKWVFFSIITLGIYTWFIPVSKTKWIVSHLHYEDENYIKGDSYFDGNTFQLIGINILTFIITLVSFGLLYPFAVCLKLKWVTKHSIINRKKLVFNGSGLHLWGKYILWSFLTAITLGIFALWLPIVEWKWEAKHTHIKTLNEVEQKTSKQTVIIVAAVALLFTIIFGVVVSKLAETDIPENIDNVYGFSSIDSPTDVLEVAARVFLPFIFLTKSNTKEFALPERELNHEELDGSLRNNVVAERTLPEGRNVTTEPEKQNYIKVGGYKISFGTYTGRDALYDIENQKEIPVDIVVVLSENGIFIDGNNESYSVVNDKILVWGNEILQAVGENKLVYLAQSCPTLEYQG